MTPDELMTAALAVAEEALAAGELPIGAVVAVGDDIVGRAYTQEKTLGRRLVHADLLAMIAADEALGWRRRAHPLQLAVTLEPCLMCLGAAMALGVREAYYGLASPADGGGGIAAAWRPHPDMPWYAAPAMTGGLRQDDVRELFGRYADTAPAGPLRDWACTLAPDAQSEVGSSR